MFEKVIFLLYMMKYVLILNFFFFYINSFQCTIFTNIVFQKPGKAFINMTSPIIYVTLNLSLM